MPWPITWDRATVRGAIEEAGGAAMSVDDSLPDTLIAVAQALGLEPVTLQTWIYDQPKPEWSGAALARWARVNGFIPGTELSAAIPPAIPEEPDTPESVAEKAKAARKVFDIARGVIKP